MKKPEIKILNGADVVEFISEETLSQLYSHRELVQGLAEMDRYFKELEKQGHKFTDKDDKVYFFKDTLDKINTEIIKRESQTDIGESYV
jgi:hypothetical protein